MPINFGDFVYKPHPLQQWNIGEGLNSIIEGNRERARQAQQESQYARTRSDSQTNNAATFARDNVNTAYDAGKGKYDKQMKAIYDARAAVQSGHHDVADALIPTILALGGQAEKRGGKYFFKEGAGPTRGEVDVGAARRQLYQGAPPGTGAGQPFQVPGFGAGGQRNPFEPPAVSGASAAALPPPTQSPPPAMPAQPSPPPPTGSAGKVPPPDAGWVPPEDSTSTMNSSSSAIDLSSQPEAVASPQAEQSGSPQPTGPNPFQAPGLDPYTIDPEMVRQRNNESLAPFLSGVASAADTGKANDRNKGRIEAINKYVNSLNLPPAEAIKVTEKLYGEIFAQMRTEVQAEGQSGRLAQMSQNQQSVRDDKSRQFAVQRINKLTDNDSLKATKQKLTAGREAQRLIPDAHRNGNSANALIESIYRMKNTGVMTDKDFERSSAGVQSLWGKIQKGLLNTLLHPDGGFDPTTVADLKELVDTAMASHDETMRIAASSLIRGYRSAPNNIEREEFGRAIVSFLPEEYLPEEFVEPWMERARKGGGVPIVSEDDEQATMERMAAEEGGLGVVDVPAGRHPTTPMARGSRVPPKPPRKDPKKMSKAELKAEMDRLTEEANAP